MDLTNISTDMTEDEIKSLDNYITNGKPGFMKANETDIFSWLSLYMNGKSYSEIAQITKSKKDLILFMAHRGKWYEKRLEHYQDLAENMLEKLKRTKIDSANTVSTIVTSLGKYYKDKFDKFLSTNNRDIIDEIDTKMLSQYYKAIEALEKIVGNSSSGSSGGAPTVNVNLGTDATVQHLDDDTIEITDQTAGKLLKALADFKKDK